MDLSRCVTKLFRSWMPASAFANASTNSPQPWRTRSAGAGTGSGYPDPTTEKLYQSPVSEGGGERRHKLEELKKLFEQDAQKYQIYPIDPRISGRQLDCHAAMNETCVPLKPARQARVRSCPAMHLRLTRHRLDRRSREAAR